MKKMSSSILAIVLLMVGINPLLADDISVTAGISRQEVNSGDMAELQIKVSGAQQADVPQQIAVEGLNIRLTGQSTQVQMVNFKVSSSVVYSYIVMPLRTGKFMIPSVTVTADGRQFRTQSLTFSVLDASASSAAPSAQPPSTTSGILGFTQPRQRTVAPKPDIASVAFGEINCPKKTLYAGEMVPVEIRYYFDARYATQVRGNVDFGGEGVLVERFPEPKEGREERNGVLYNVLTFRSLLSGVKPGSIDLAAAKLDCQIQLPGELPPGFDDPVFQQLLGGQARFGQTRELAVKTAPLHLEVLPLPKEGRPASFAGAVGQFDIDAMVSNQHLAPGDPATLSVKIGGKGNFKGMGPPVLTASDDWRTYPPTDRFDSSDELSYTGVKSFDFTLIAQKPTKLSPGAEFSFFDPQSGKYQTLVTKPLPLDASPGNSTIAPGNSLPGKKSLPNPSPVSNPSLTPREGDPIQGLTLHSWKTPVQRSEFFIASISMLIGAGTLAAALWFRDLQARGGTAATRRKRRLSALLVILKDETMDAASTYDAAVEYLEMTLRGDSSEALLATMIARRDQFKYGTGGTFPLSKSEREQLLSELCSSVPTHQHE
jgi:hypothetical protein